MKVVESFVINKKQHIDIVVPENKCNYYYKPTDQISKFDEVLVVYKDEERDIVIGSEMIDMVIEDLRDACLRILNSEAALPDSLSIGSVGYQYNLTAKNEGFSDLYLSICLWSGKLKHTFLYEKNGKIYLEIASTYPWLFEESKQDKQFVPFEEFMKSYKSTVLEISDKSVVQTWLSQCEQLLSIITANHAQRLKDKAL